MNKSKYYYDYTRNMNYEQTEEFCKENCNCCKKENKLFSIFKDDNDYNEKSIVGFIAFAIMIFVIFVDVITGFFGQDLVIKEFVYNSFVIIVLGSFGISGVEKMFNKK